MPQIQWQPVWISHTMLLVGVILSLIILLRGLRGQATVIEKVIALLRLLVIAALVVSGYRPVIIQMVPAAASKQVVIIVDDSKSMSINDSNHATSEIVEYGESVGAIDRGVIVSTSRQLSDPVNQIVDILSQEKNQKIDPLTQSGIGQLVVTIRNMIRGNASHQWIIPLLAGFDQQLNGTGSVIELGKIARQIRTELAARLDRDFQDFLEGDEDLRDTIDRLMQSTRFALAQKAASSLFYSLNREMQVELRDFQSQLRLVDLAASQPLENESPIIKTLRQVVERYGQQMPDGIVLLTDGRSTEMRTSISAALIASGVPVYPVMMVSSNLQPDVRILGIDTPGIAMENESVDIVVRIRPRSAEGQTAVVKLTDHRITLSRSVVLGNTDASVRFEYHADQAGLIPLEVTIDTLAGESHAENNFATRNLNVVADKIKIAVLHRDDSEEMQQLVGQLSEISWIKLDGRQLDKPDVMIINHPLGLSAQQVAAVTSAVLEDGKSLLIVDTPAAELNAMLTSAQWQKLFPVASIGRESIKTIDQVVSPSLNQYILGTNRLEWHAGASGSEFESQVRLVQQADLSPLMKNGFAVLSDEKTKSALMVGMMSRRGKVVISGFTGTSHWSTADAGRFWSRLVRGLIDWPVRLNDQELDLWVESTEITQGDSINLIATARARSAGSVQVLMKFSDRSIESIQMTESFPGCGQWFGRVTPRLAGECSFVFHQGTIDVSKSLLVKPDLDAEVRDVAPDEPFMRRIAAATGGQVFRLDQIAQIPASINQRISNQTRRVERNIWCSQYLFLAIAGLLGLEWSIRKLSGKV